MRYSRHLMPKRAKDIPEIRMNSPTKRLQQILETAISEKVTFQREKCISAVIDVHRKNTAGRSNK
ncbi:MAG: hypothetical protein M2R45_00209 [Verrucomicrobia subdivision 3 bacterium]|nr:hypothetical protein [Limisphaerales bacterium]MCS1412333.1 hypothetical protein [Limisphaerales bacterium]